MKIDIIDLSYAYPNGEAIFSRISFSISSGQIISILGPNGAGKTTLLNCIAMLHTPSAGEIRIDGRDARKMKPRDVAQCVGYVPQVVLPSFDYEVLDYVVTGCAPRMGTFQKPKEEHYQLAWQAIEQMGIQHLAHKSYARISGGERQQVSIARALAQRPGIILMDEPTAHLDYGNQIKVLRTIQQLSAQGYGIVLTTHNPDHVLLLDDTIAVLDRKGHLTFGTNTEIMDEAFLTQLYGTELRLLDAPHLGRRICVAPRLRVDEGELH